MFTRLVMVLCLSFLLPTSIWAQDDDGGFEPPPPPDMPPPPPIEVPPPGDGPDNDGGPVESDSFDSSGPGDSFQLESDPRDDPGEEDEKSSTADTKTPPASDTAVEGPSILDTKIEESEIKFHNRSKGGRRMFGAYKIHLGASKPTYADIKDYNQFYGEPRIMPTLAVDYYFFDWFATLGFTFRFSYYKDNGHAVREVNGELEKQKDSPLELTLVPLQAGLAIQATPFQAKWVVIGGWFAAEALYYQEVRVAEDEDKETKTTTPTTTSRFGFLAEPEAEEDKPFVNTGWKMGTAIGVTASFLLNALEERPVRSLSTIGISSVYLTPYVEMVSANTKKGITFGRSAYGLAFTFETM